MWYVETNSAVGQTIYDAIGELLRRQDFSSPLLRLSPFIDAMADGHPFNYRFDWEREWRVPGGLDFELDEVAFVMTPTGDGLHVFGSGLDLLPSQSVTDFVTQAMEVLGDPLDLRIARFLEEFTDPAEVLPYETAEGGYQWFVAEWDTADGVVHVFGTSLSEEDYEELVAALDDLSTSWASLAELKFLHE